MVMYCFPQVSDQLVDMEDITMCIRFNYKRLGFYQGRSALIRIQDWRTQPGVKFTEGIKQA